MNRTQILLDRWQYETLKGLSERKGVSLSSLVREAVGSYLRAAESESVLGLEQMEGIGSDGQANGREHDAHLYPRARR